MGGNTAPILNANVEEKMRTASSFDGCFPRVPSEGKPFPGDGDLRGIELPADPEIFEARNSYIHTGNALDYHVISEADPAADTGVRPNTTAG